MLDAISTAVAVIAGVVTMAILIDAAQRRQQRQDQDKDQAADLRDLGFCDAPISVVLTHWDTIPPDPTRALLN